MKLIIGRSSKLLGEREKFNDESFSEKCENFNPLPSLFPLQFNLKRLFSESRSLNLV